MKKRCKISAAAALAAAIALAGAAYSHACVGRTLFIGHFDAPEQAMVANILSVFIDERTGTTVKLRRFPTRAEAFEAVRKDRVSIYADYSSVILRMIPGEKTTLDQEKNFARLKEVLSRDYNVVLLEPFGYDRYFAGKPNTGELPGQAGVMVCKDAISKFPALPKLLAKLRGALDNGTMASLLAEAEKSDVKSVARRFLKSRRLI